MAWVEPAVRRRGGGAGWSFGRLTAGFGAGDAESCSSLERGTHHLDSGCGEPLRQWIVFGVDIQTIGAEHRSRDGLVIGLVSK